jgi:hypothetical protein
MSNTEPEVVDAWGVRRPANIRDIIGRKMASTPKVDSVMGKPLPAPEPVVPAVAVEPAPTPAGMKPNPAQGGSAAGSPVASPGVGSTVAERIKFQTEKLATQPPPPGY